MSDARFKIECRHDVVAVSFDQGTHVTPELIMKVIARENAIYDNSKRSALLDFRGCLPSDDFGYDAIARIVHFIARQPDIQWKRQLAIVVDAVVQYGLSRMYQALVDNYPTEIRIFYDREEAFNWAAVQ